METTITDLGGRVGWLLKAERVKTLFLSPLQPQRGGGGGGGVGGVSRLRFPPGPHLRSSRFSRHPRLCQPTMRKIVIWFWGKGSRPLVGRAPSPGGPGPKPPGDPAQRSLGPGSRHEFLTSCCVSKTLGCYHNPQSADLGGRWMVSEGGALQSHNRRGSRLRISAAGPGPAPENLANKPLSPASRQPSRVKNCSSAHEKPGLLHRLICCAQSLQPSLTFLLRRNNKVQGAVDRLTT